MSREWKPGDVAMVECSDGLWRQAFCMHDQFSARLDWWFGNRVFRYVASSVARPLVVIDPEDRAQVERLLTDYLTRYDGMETRANSCEVAYMQTALRSFIAPPKPDEPTGLGAVVERADGRRWVRGPKAWTNLDATGAYLNWSNWLQVNEDSPVVTILSEGVTP